MGLWGEGSGLSIGGVFDGGITSEGDGARLKLGIDLPVLPDIPLVNVKLPGFRDGGVVGGRRYPAPRGVGHRGTRADAAQASADRRREGVELAPPARPTRAHSHAAPGHGTTASTRPSGPSVRHFGGIGDGVAPMTVRGAFGGAIQRMPWETAPGVACPSCASGATVPVR